MAQNRLIVFLLTTIGFLILLATELPAMLTNSAYSGIFAISLFSGFITVLVSYWLYDDGKKIEYLMGNPFLAKNIERENKEATSIDIVKQLEATKASEKTCWDCRYDMSKLCPNPKLNLDETFRKNKKCGSYKP